MNKYLGVKNRAPEGESGHSAPVILTICTTCRQGSGEATFRPGPVLLEQLAAMVEPGIMLRGTQCLSVCQRPVTAALSGPGRYTFLFGDLDAASDSAALMEMARAMTTRPFGFVPWKDRPDSLRNRIVARIPPPEWAPDDGAAPA